MIFYKILMFLTSCQDWVHFPEIAPKKRKYQKPYDDMSLHAVTSEKNTQATLA